MKKYAVALSALFFLLCTAATAGADVRQYTWTYGYMTPAKNEIEFEWWYDFQKKPDRTVSLPLMEVEYGITDHWVAGLYGVLVKDGAQSWKFDEVRLEQRYRLFDPGVLPVDTALYFEYKHNFVEDENELEGKVILSKDFGRFNSTVNLIVEQVLKGGEDTEYGYSAGVSYPLSDVVRPGVEAFGAWKGEESEHYVGPSVALYLGKTWVNAGVGFGYAKDSDDFQMRVILSHEL